MLARALIWRPLRRDVVRTLLSVLAVALGVAVAVAIRIANRSAVAGFQQTTEALAGPSDLLVTGPDPIPASLLPRLAPLAAQADITPYIQRQAYDPQARNGGDTLDLLGLDLGALAAKGVAPSSGPTAPTSGLLLGAAYAKAHNLHAGDSLDLVVAGAQHRFDIDAVLPGQGVAAVQQGNVAILDLPQAVAIFSPGAPAFDGLTVTVAPGMNSATVAAELRPLLPPADTVEPPSAREHQDKKMLAALQLNLQALAYVALLIGLFLIYNTVSISVVRRSVGIATVRALGAGRVRILSLFLGEGLLLAIAGGLLGLLLGRFLAGGALRLVSTSISATYAVSRPAPPGFTLSDAVWGLLLAVGAGVLASFAPARQAASIAPAEGLRGASEEGALRSNRVRLLILTMVFAVIAIVCCRLPLIFGLPLAGFFAATAAVACVAALTPLLLGALLPPLRSWFLHRGRVSAGLAAAGLSGALRRSAVLTVALAVASGVMFAVAIMVGSFRHTVVAWIDEQLQADVYIRAVDWTRNHPVAISPDWIAHIAAVPGVAGIEASHTQSWTFDDEPIFINTRWSLNATGAGRRAPNAVTVSEPFARRFHLWQGSVLHLVTPRGPAGFTIADVFSDYTNDRGVLAFPVAVWRQWFSDPSPSEVELTAAPGIGSAELRRRVRLALGDAPLVVNDNASLRAVILAIFDRTFRVTYALEAITLLVAIIGVANTLLAVVLERRREFAILRFLGATRAQIRRLLLAESALVGGLALAIGAGLAVILAQILVRVINVQSFGWTSQFYFPFAFLIPAAALVWLATLAAGWLPSRVALREDPLKAVAAE